MAVIHCDQCRHFAANNGFFSDCSRIGLKRDDSWGYFLRGIGKLNLKMKEEAQLDMEKAREIAPDENFKFEDYTSTL